MFYAVITVAGANTRCYTVRNHGGHLNKLVESIYLRELKIQCNYACRSAVNMDEIIGTLLGGQKYDQNLELTARFFYEISHFLQHAASISKLLWSPGNAPAAVGRSEYLRLNLLIDQEHDVKSRKLRNHFEHFDERLDIWANLQNGANFIDMNIGDYPHDKNGEVKQQDILRHYNPEGKVFTFQGDVFNIGELSEGIEQIERKINVRLKEIASQ
jgi:hypothetical protein